MATFGSLAPSPRAASQALAEFIEYANRGAIRNKPLQPELVNAMSFLPGLGLTMRVTSGGQDGIGEGSRRTGSTRHDHGGAGDVQFIRGGRALSWENPQDVTTLQDVIRKARENGVTGIGAGPGYMNPTATHIGFGRPAIWGAKGGAPYPALVEAVRGAPGAVPQSQPQPQPAVTIASASEGPTPAMANPAADMPAPGAVETQSQFATPAPSWGQSDNDQLMMALALIANAIPNGQVAKDPGSVIKPWMDMRARREDREYMRGKDARDFDLRKSEIERAQSNADRSFNLQTEASRRADEAARRAEANAGKTDLIKNYEYDMRALEAEGKPRVPFSSWRENWAKTTQPQTTINNITGGTPELRKKLDAKEGESWAAAREAATNSAGSLQDIDILTELSTTAPQGPLVGRLAQALPGLSDAGAAYQSVISRVAPTLRAPGSGATSDIEYEGMVRSLPSLVNRPEANAAIIGAMRAKANINIARGEIISEFMNGKIDETAARTRLDGLNRQSIMTPELQGLLRGANGGPLDRAPAATTPPTTSGFTREQLEAEARRRGILK